MREAAWAVLAMVAALWPARLAGPLDGVPLDTPFEAIAIGVVAVALLVFNPTLLRRWWLRGPVLALLLWKVASGAVVTQDGWCLRFTTPAPIFRDMGLVPHTWDVRADWRSPDPTCSAIVTRAYPSIDRFPVWFFNLPPADPRETPAESDRPPLASLRMDLSGYLSVRRAGVLRIELGEDMRPSGRVDGVEVRADDVTRGIPLDAGLHHVEIAADLSGSRWRLMPTWDGANLWRSEIATLHEPRRLDGWVRPWGRFVPLLLLGVVLMLAAGHEARRLSLSAGAFVVATSLAAIAMAAVDRPALMRAFPLLLLPAAFITWPRHLANFRGLRWLIAVPMLVLVATMASPQVGAVTWYTGGDDWWMFQRFAYRIFMQGYWLEGGTPTFWFQPLYRWMAGALHLVFGDSSVGELLWDCACLLTCAGLAFHLVRVVAGFRWGLAAATMTLAVFTLGPGWYLIGRGLSEISSAGFISGAALLALRGRAGSSLAVVCAGILATLAFYARLNNLAMAVAVAAFAWPVRQPAADLWAPASLRRLASRPVLLGVFGGLAIGLWLFTMRTWYYTGVPSMLFGTQAGTLSVWQPTDDGRGILANVLGSVLMVLTMNDPPRLDVRSLPIVAGALVAVLAATRVRPFRALPLNAVALCLAGLAGALVARGTAYPGRFSIHLIPVTVALFVSALSLLRPVRRQGNAA